MSHRLTFRFGLLGVFAVVLAVAGPVSARPEDGDSTVLRSYYSGNGFLNRGNYDLAAAEYRKFLDANPRHEKANVARYGLTVSLFRLQKYKDAVPELEKLAGVSGFQYAAEASMIEGQCHLALGNNDGAVTALQRLLKDQPQHDLADEALAIQAEALYRGGRHDQVAAPAGRLVSEHPQSPQRERAELFWGLADMAQGSFGDAADRFDGMAKRFPQGTYADQTTLLLAQSRHRDDDLDPAATAYRKVITQGNVRFTPDALYGLGLLLHQQGKPAEAAPFLDQLLEAHGDHKLVRDTRMMRGRVAFDLGEIDGAQTQFEQVVATEGPRRDEAVYWLAKCELREQTPAEAAARLEQALREHPGSELRAEMTYDRAVALLRADDPDGALKVLSDFRSQFPSHLMAADALHLMAVTEHQQARFERSQGLCREFLATYGDHGGATLIAFLVGENEFLPGNYEAAAEAYRKFRADYPQDSQQPKATYRLGMSLHQLDRFEDGREHLDAVVDGPRTTPEFRSALLALGDGHFQRDEWGEAEGYLFDYVEIDLEQPASDDAMLKLGLARHRQEDFEGAIEAYDKLRASFDDSPFTLQAVFERGQACIALDRDDEAAEAFRRTLEEGPESQFASHAMNHLGALSMQGEDFTAAAEHYAKTAEAASDPTMAGEARFQQGQALVAAERFDAAAVAFGRLLRENPDSDRVATAAAMEAVSLARHGDHEGALGKIEGVERTHASALEPELLVAMSYEKAWCQRELERHDDAAATYRKLLQHPGEGGLHHYSLIELAELEFDAERYDVAAGHLRDLRKQSDVPADLKELALYRLGVCEFHLGNFDVASKLLDEFVTTWPQSEHMASASLFCGDALFQLGRHQPAVAHLKRVVEKYKDDEECGPSMLRLGECLAVLQEYSESEQVFSSYQERYDESPLWYQAQFGVGWALENQGRFQQAIGAYQKVLDQHQGPTAARAQFQIGECFFAENNYEEAARELLKVDILYAYPEWSAAALYEAGRCFEELSNPVDARRQYEKVVEHHQGTDWAKLANGRLSELRDSGLPGR